MRAFDEIYVHPSFSPEPTSPSPASSSHPSQSAGSQWPYALVGTAVTVAVASGVGMAVGVPGILSAFSGR